MDDMFNGASSFNTDISQWDVGSVNDIRYMFYGASSFTYELCWNTSNVQDKTEMFVGSKGKLLPYPECMTWETSTGPSQIIYGLSPEDNEYCMLPYSNYVSKGSQLVIGTCKPWKGYKWTFDEEGKIHNYKDASLCINMKGQYMSLETCVDGKIHQRWQYSSNKGRILWYKNGRKGLLVDNNVASENSQVKLLKYNVNSDTQSDVWKLKYDSTGEILPLPSFKDPFQIVSGVYDDNNKWCLYPKSFHIVQGTRISISPCEDWKSFKFIVEKEGKIHSFMNNKLCVTRKGRRIQLSTCKEGQVTQQWSYSLMDKKLLVLVNGRKQVTLKGEEDIKKDNLVEVLSSESNGSLNQMWYLM